MKAKIIKFDRQKANFDDGFRLFQRFSDTGKPTASSTIHINYKPLILNGLAALIMPVFPRIWNYVEKTLYLHSN